MEGTRLILVDGISGLGKSTTAQWLCQQLQNNGVAAKWYHEEEPGHPLQSRFDVENLQDAAEVAAFMQEVSELWQQFLRLAETDDRVYIIESILLQDTARVLWQHLMPGEQIAGLMQSVLQQMDRLNPRLIYLWHQDAEAATRRIWQRRGPSWARWAIATDAKAPYAATVGGSAEDKAIALWKDYQSFSLQLLDELQLPVLAIESSAGDWSEYRRQMLDFMGLEQRPCSLQIANGDYAGEYNGQISGRQLQLRLRWQDGQLLADSSFLWPNMRLLPAGDDRFVVESLPLTVEFQRNTDTGLTGLVFGGISCWAGAKLERTASAKDLR